jgi:hypothetical protein
MKKVFKYLLHSPLPLATGTRRKASENPEKHHLEALGRMGAIAVFSRETRIGFPCPGRYGRTITACFQRLR